METHTRAKTTSHDQEVYVHLHASQLRTSNQGIHLVVVLIAPQWQLAMTFIGPRRQLPVETNRAFQRSGCAADPSDLQSHTS
jgi:hypothetical protein